jgi:TolB-like protein/tetratricopeptide (TPR) repeat protein
MYRRSSVSAGGNGFPDEIRCGTERVSSEVVRSELERICSSLRFQASERRRAFLRFIVDETLSGRAQSLKGYTIALAVFGRDESFDPQADPVVRLEARRLRRDLASYYMDGGQNDAVLISIPKGSYVPNFEWHKGPPPATSASGAAPEPREIPARDNAYGPKQSAATFRRRALIVAIVTAGFAIGLALCILPFGTAKSPFGSPREPAVMVMPFEALSPGESAHYLAGGMGQELISNLFRFSGFRLYTSPVGSNQDSKFTSMQAARNLGAAYLVNGSVQADVDNVRVTTSVVNASSGEIVWTKTFGRPYDPQSLIRTQRELADEIAAVIGQPYGVVSTDMSDRSSAPAVSSMESYMCVLRAYGYRRSFFQADFNPAIRCLEQTVQRDPEYSDAWAMLGWLHLDAGRLGFIGHDRQKEYQKALEAISNAVKLQPSNPVALKALAAAYHFTGRFNESQRLTRQLVELNPNDPEILAQLGWRLSARGNFDEGVATLQRAIDRTLNPPTWYFHFVAVDLYLKGNYEQSRKISERAALADSGFSQLVLAASNAELGDREGTRLALEKLARYEPLARDTEGFLRRQGVADHTVNILLAGLKKARVLASQ